MRQINPEYLFVLIWPFRSEVIKEEIKFIKNGGKMIFNLPKFHIVNKFNYKKYLKKILNQTLTISRQIKFIKFFYL